MACSAVILRLDRRCSICRALFARNTDFSIAVESSLALAIWILLTFVGILYTPWCSSSPAVTKTIGPIWNRASKICVILENRNIAKELAYLCNLINTMGKQGINWPVKSEVRCKSRECSLPMKSFLVTEQPPPIVWSKFGCWIDTSLRRLRCKLCR